MHDFFQGWNGLSKVQLEYLQVSNHLRRYDWCFCRLNNTKKGATNCYKLKRKVCLIYLEIKLHIEGASDADKKFKFQ